MTDSTGPEKFESLFDDGKGRNEIARIMGISTRQVDRLARDAGVRFNRARTHVATVARARGIAGEVVALAEQAAGVAWVSWMEAQKPGLPARDRRELSVSGAAAFDKVIVSLARILGDDFTPEQLEAGSRLGRLRSPTREPPAKSSDDQHK